MHAAPVLAGICGVIDREILILLVSTKLASTSRRRAMYGLTLASPAAVSRSSAVHAAAVDGKHNTHSFTADILSKMYSRWAILALVSSCIERRLTHPRCQETV